MRRAAKMGVTLLVLAVFLAVLAGCNASSSSSNQGGQQGQDEKQGESGQQGQDGGQQDQGGQQGQGGVPGGEGGQDVTPGRVVGTVVDPQGNPMEGVEVAVGGLGAADGNLGGQTQTDANGEYSMDVPEGSFTAYGDVKRTFEGKGYTFDLHPVSEQTGPFKGEEGARRDFQWKLSGLRPDKDPSKESSYYGAAVDLNLMEMDAVDAPPDDAVARFTLTPAGPLVDGSEGEILTFERTIGGMQGRGGGGLDSASLLYDIPLGTYTMRGELNGPDGTRPLFFKRTSDPRAANERAETVEIDNFAQIGSLPSNVFVDVFPTGAEPTCTTNPWDQNKPECQGQGKNKAEQPKEPDPKGTEQKGTEQKGTEQKNAEQKSCREMPWGKVECV